MKKILFIVFAAFSLLLAACGGQAAEAVATPAAPTNPSEVVAEGHVVPVEDVRLAFSARGRVAEILVAEGQAVKAGDVLARLADREQAQAAVAATQLQLTQAQQEYDVFMRAQPLDAANAWNAYQQAQITRAEAQRAWEKIDPNDLRDQVDEADTDVKDKKNALEDAQDEADKYKDLKEDNPTRRDAEDALRQAEADYNEALRNVEEIQRELDEPRAALDTALAAEAEALRVYESIQTNGVEPEQQAILQAQLDNAKAQLASAQNTLDSYELKAPFGGTVTDLNIALGQYIGSETWAIQLADFSDWYIETSDLTELEVVNLAEGQQAEIKPDALPEVTLTGVITNISQASKTQGGDVLYTVTLQLNETDPALRWGMTVEINFLPAE
jgi:multidrug resistance efflux pump